MEQDTISDKRLLIEVSSFIAFIVFIVWLGFSMIVFMGDAMTADADPNYERRYGDWDFKGLWIDNILGL